MNSVPSTLDPGGPAAAQIAHVWWVMLALGAVLYVLTLLFLVLALRHRSARPAILGSKTFVYAWGIVVPVVALVAVMILNTRTSLELFSPEPTTMQVEVVGHQFFWEVRYPEVGAVTANEIHIPVGEPVEVRLESSDVIHSLWVPELGRKTDLIPGHPNTMVLQADEPGIYRGVCAEFCGIQHARMHVLVVAEPRDEFEAWLADIARPADPPDDPLERRGREVFLENSCAACHTIRGVSTVSDVGPDLTHLADRNTLAAGLLENNRGNLAGWVLDPQALKPGVRMPPTSLTGPQLEALLAYLESLE